MSQPFLGEIKVISWHYPPKGWALCDGGFLPINQNQGLFSLLGTVYGGNGQTTFGLPDLRGRAAMHMGNGHVLGEVGGHATATITQQTMPQHVHFLQGAPETPAQNLGNTSGNSRTFGQGLIGLQGGGTAPVNMYAAPLTAPTTLAAEVVTSIGGSQAHNNMMPSLALMFIIALQGIFPSQT